MFRYFKRILAAFFTVLLVLSCSGCKKAVSESENADEITVFSTFYPLYAFTNMVSNDVEGVRTLCLVQPQDGCLREYQLSDWDLALLLRSADVIISGGRGLESFENVLFALGENGPAVSAVLYNMELAKADAAGIPEDEESHWNDDNPHIYMCIDGAIELTERISASMQAADPRFSDAYMDNCTAAVEKLRDLQSEMHKITGDISGIKTAVLNEACWYVTEEFDLDASVCYHRESGADIDNKEALINAIAASGAELVLIEKQAPYSLVEALEESGMCVAKIDILSTHRENEGAEGYFEAQIANANAIHSALNE